MPYDLRQTHARTRGRSGREVSGQYRVTVPDPDALERLRMQNHVYDRTLMPRDWFMGSVPIRVRSLPGSSRESSTEPMDTDEGAKTTRNIVESVCVARGWVHSDSKGYPPDTNSPLLTARSRREGPGSMATRGEMSGGDPRRRQNVTECHREVLLLLGVPSDTNAARHVTEKHRGYHPVGCSVRRLDAERNLELANAEFRTTADADQVPESV